VLDERLADGGPGVLVARRVEPGPDGDELPINCPGGLFEAMQLSGIEPPPQPTESPTATLPPVTTPPAQGGVGEDISTTSSTSPS
jgi:hypothetical protein